MPSLVYAPVVVVAAGCVQRKLQVELNCSAGGYKAHLSLSAVASSSSSSARATRIVSSSCCIRADESSQLVQTVFSSRRMHRSATRRLNCVKAAVEGGMEETREAPAGPEEQLTVNPIERLLSQSPGGVAALDGGLATELEARGADLNNPLWSASCLLDRPELVQQVHYDYFAAGADVAITCSYQATTQGFSQRRGLDADQSRQFWSQLQAKGNLTGRAYPLVAASIGSYGAYLADGSEYRGNYGVSVEELMNFHRPRLAVLASSQADILAFETVPCVIEAQAIVRLLQEEFPSAFAWISFSGKDGSHACSGEHIAEAVAAVTACPQVVAIGINCTAPFYIVPLLQLSRAVTDKPFVVYPNKGEGWDEINKTWLPGTFVDDVGFASLVPQWMAAGAKLVGGCCRTTPNTIQAVSNALHKKPQPKKAASENVEASVELLNHQHTRGCVHSIRIAVQETSSRQNFH
eukprot:jgi/Chlat1/5526/Chrsp369S08994